MAYPPTLPVGYRLSLRGPPPTVPWPRPSSRDGGMALLVVKAAETAARVRADGLLFGYWVGERALRELEDPASCRAMQAGRGSVGCTLEASSCICGGAAPCCPASLPSPCVLNRHERQP